MTRLLICPPVGPYHTVEELRAWIRELEALREKHAGDAEAQADVDGAMELAAEWLSWRAENDAKRRAGEGEGG